VFCFFGGTFPTVFAAIQAAEYGGRKKVMDAIIALSDEALMILEEVKKDDDIDADKDGKNDVDQISGSELLQRKTLLVLKKMNPQKIDTAISTMYTVWLSVAAVLAVEFARTISMALAIAEFLQKPCEFVHTASFWIMKISLSFHSLTHSHTLSPPLSHTHTRNQAIDSLPQF
jgi:hypothetical protein